MIATCPGVPAEKVSVGFTGAGFVISPNGRPMLH
jgi:hypothetical protein